MLKFKDAWQREKEKRKRNCENFPDLKKVLYEMGEFEELQVNPDIFFFVPSLIWFNDSAKNAELFFDRKHVKVLKKEGRYVFWVADWQNL